MAACGGGRGGEGRGEVGWSGGGDHTIKSDITASHKRAPLLAFTKVTGAKREDTI